MPEKTVKKISDMLNEEKWTRATLNSYTVNNFKELDEYIREVEEKGVQEEVTDLCSEHLTHTKNSIIGLYISGILALNRQNIDDSYMIMVINIFSDNHKWNIVEYLCHRILDFGENRYALRTLSECYDTENEEEKKFEIWERLIRVDHDESDIVKELAVKYENEENTEKAIELYKKAIHRYINKKQFTEVKEIWEKLISYNPEELDFFFHVDTKILKQLNAERAAQLLEELYEHFKARENWDVSIDILKRILDYEPKNAWARTEITECFRHKFADHSHLDEYIKISNLNQNFRNVHDAINDFEKHIAFDVGNFVSHKAWGIGRIKSLKGDEIIIDFVRKRDHKMSLKMAVNALNSLDKNHIAVLKVRKKKESLYKKVKEDIPWALKTVIKSFDNAASMKQIKAELVPSVLSDKEWPSWSSGARKVLKDDPIFGNLPERIDLYMVRDTPISIEEKTFNKFKAEKTFFNKVKALDDFLEVCDPDSDFFAEVFNYFSNNLKAVSTYDETAVSSFYALRKIIDRFPFMATEVPGGMTDILHKVEEMEAVFNRIESPWIRQEVLQDLKKLPDWPDLFIRLFPQNMSYYIIRELTQDGYPEKLQELYSNIVDRYKEYREAFIWLAKNEATPSWCQEYGFTYEKILICMIHLLDITYREINNKRDVSANRKMNKQIHAYLFKEERVKNYIAAADHDSITRLYSLIQDVKDLDPGLKIEIKHFIVEKYPDFKFHGEKETKVVSRGLLVSEASFKKKQAELQHIQDVEIPANSKEIGAAIELGDLSENAEYKAGKEKQELLQIQVGRIKDDLDKAQIFKADQIDASKVSFGTVVELKNNLTGEDETYTVMGPWESDPNSRIISYLSPFGNELFNHQSGENLKFEINERQYDYTIKSISAAEF